MIYIGHRRDSICYIPSSLFSRDQQATVGSLLRTKVFFPGISAERTEQPTKKKTVPIKDDLIDSFAPPFFRESTYRAAKHV